MSLLEFLLVWQPTRRVILEVVPETLAGVPPSEGLTTASDRTLEGGGTNRRTATRRGRFLNTASRDTVDFILRGLWGLWYSFGSDGGTRRGGVFVRFVL